MNWTGDTMAFTVVYYEVYHRSEIGMPLTQLPTYMLKGDRSVNMAEHINAPK
jgi:hypothetical protein